MTMPSALINPRKGEVALGDAALRFPLDALERLHAAYVGDWWTEVVTGLGNLQPSALARCLRAARCPWPDAPLAEIADAVGDALCLAMNGKTRAALIDAQADAPAHVEQDVEKPVDDALERIRAAGYRAGLNPADVDTLTPWQIAKLVEVRGNDRWEELVHSAWLQGHLNALAWHIPKDYPKTPNELLKKAETSKAPKSVEQQKRELQAFIFAVTGKWKSLDPDKPDDPTT
ncbi:MAG: hypothetical protein ACOH2N_13430 [Devosia sp.]